LPRAWYQYCTLYNWEAKYGGLEASQLKRIKELEEENNKLKRMYADVSILRLCRCSSPENCRMLGVKV